MTGDGELKSKEDLDCFLSGLAHSAYSDSTASVVILVKAIIQSLDGNLTRRSGSKKSLNCGLSTKR